MDPEFFQKLKEQGRIRLEEHNRRVQEQIARDRAVIIPRDQLVKGAYYRGRCRNADLARWDGQIFHHWGYEFGGWHLYTIHCPEDEAHYDVFQAWELVEDPDREIPLG